MVRARHHNFCFWLRNSMTKYRKGKRRGRARSTLCLAKGAGSVLGKMRCNLLKWQSMVLCYGALTIAAKAAPHARAVSLLLNTLISPVLSRAPSSTGSRPQQSVLAHGYDLPRGSRPHHHCWLPCPHFFFFAFFSPSLWKRWLYLDRC